MDSNNLFDKFPFLETAHLVLRELRLTDAEAIYQIFSDEEVMKYYGTPVITSMQHAHQVILANKGRFKIKEGICWGITRKGEDVIIGICSYVSIEKRPLGGILWGEISYILAKNYWQQGVMTEVLHSIIPFGFEQMGLNRIEAEVVTDNIASIQLLHRLGFHEEGTLRERGFWNGIYHDLKMFSLLRREFKGKKAQQQKQFVKPC